MQRPTPAWEESLLRKPEYADVPLAPEFERFLDQRRAEIGPKTERAYRQAFTYFLRWFEATRGEATLASVSSVATFAAYRQNLSTRSPEEAGHSAGQRLSDESVHTYLRPLKTFCNYLVGANWLTANPFNIRSGGPRLLPRLSAEARIVRTVTAAELERLVAHLRAAVDPLAMRDLVLLLVAWTTGLRNGDLRKLRVAGLSFEREEAEVRDSKWRRDGLVVVDPDVAPLLRAYLAEVRPQLVARLVARGEPDPGWLFLSEAGGTGRNTDGQLSESAIAQMLTRRWREAGLEGHFGPHRIRHGLATFLVEAGVELERVRLWMGHSTLLVTERYVHLSRAVVAGAVQPVLRTSLRQISRRPGLREAA